MREGRQHVVKTVLTKDGFEDNLFRLFQDRDSLVEKIREIDNTGSLCGSSQEQRDEATKEWRMRLASLEEHIDKAVGSYEGLFNRS